MSPGSDPTLVAQPIRVVEDRFYCLLHASSEPCAHLALLLALEGVTRADLFARLPRLPRETTWPRYQLCRPGDGRAIPWAVDTVEGWAPWWVVGSVATLGQSVAYGRWEGGCN